MKRALSTEKGILDSQIITRNYRLASGLNGFIASGVEVALGHFINDGDLRVDGKLLTGEIENNGILKVEGIIEIESLLL